MPDMSRYDATAPPMTIRARRDRELSSSIQEEFHLYISFAISYSARLFERISCCLISTGAAGAAAAFTPLMVPL